MYHVYLKQHVVLASAVNLIGTCSEMLHYESECICIITSILVYNVSASCCINI